MACNVVTTEPTLIVFRPISGELIADRLSSVDSAETTSWRPSSDDRKNSCDKMADNTGHGLIPTGNGSARTAIR
jgi:hypothetical protein